MFMLVHTSLHFCNDGMCNHCFLRIIAPLKLLFLIILHNVTLTASAHRWIKDFKKAPQITP